MIKQKATLTIGKLLTNRGKITSSSNVLKLLFVFSLAVFFQCCSLVLTKDFVLYNNVSSTKFLFISFTLTSMISIIQQKTWKHLSYLTTKRIPILVFQSILYSFSFLCLIHGITTNGIVQYYSLFNTIQIVNAFSNINKICCMDHEHSLLPRLQLSFCLISFIIGVYILSNKRLMDIIGLISLIGYHLISYLREHHYDSALRHDKSFARIAPLIYILSALIILTLSIFSHLSLSSLSIPHHNHQYDLQEQFANDERAFMHHSANHELDVSAKITHRLLLYDYKEKMKELEELAIDDNNNNKIYQIITIYIWSLIIYMLFVLLFILLNNHLSYLQNRIYELVFHIKHQSNDLERADICKYSNNNDNNDDNDNNDIDIQTPPIYRYFVSVPFIGIISYVSLSIFGYHDLELMSVYGALIVFISNECGTPLHLCHPKWMNMVINTSLRRHHRHSYWSPSSSLFIHIPLFIQHIRENRTSRRLFIFFVLNFLFMFIEFVYGYLSNSLGLISDACHMLFDCIALMIGLLASYLGSIHSMNSNILNEDRYSYGYGKIKVMSGFINAIFLVYIGLSVLIESFERIIHPPHIHSDQLLIVSVLGLLVNLIGLFFFHDAHSLSHSHSCSHHNHEHDHNIHGIFLHILADTLGSVGVIISSLLIYFFDLTIFDALCSVFIAFLIFLTVYPLIKSTSKILLQETPSYIVSSLRNDLSNVLSSVSGIIGYREAHFWENEPGKLIGTIHIQIDEKSDSQQLLSQIHDILKLRFGFKSEKDLTIQIEKQSYLDKCDPIHHSVCSQIIPIKTTNTPYIEHLNHNHNCNHHHHHHDELPTLPQTTKRT